MMSQTYRKLEYIAILLPAIFITNSLFGQNSYKVLKKFYAADSVILVSHLTTFIPVQGDKNKKPTGINRLVEGDHKVNREIIQENYVLNKVEIDSLALILTTPNNYSIREDIKCFIPHHGILIFKKNKCSYFDICFSCRHFVSSKDVKLSDELSDKTWQTLELFFQNRNFKYEMPVYAEEVDWENEN